MVRRRSRRRARSRRPRAGVVTRLVDLTMSPPAGPPDNTPAGPPPDKPDNTPPGPPPDKPDNTHPDPPPDEHDNTPPGPPHDKTANPHNDTPPGPPPDKPADPHNNTPPGKPTNPHDNTPPGPPPDKPADPHNNTHPATPPPDPHPTNPSTGRGHLRRQRRWLTSPPTCSPVQPMSAARRCVSGGCHSHALYRGSPRCARLPAIAASTGPRGPAGRSVLPRRPTSPRPR